MTEHTPARGVRLPRTRAGKIAAALLIAALVSGALLAAIGFALDRASWQRLNPPVAVERPLAAGRSHRYRIPLRSGEALRLEAEQRGVDLVLHLGGSGVGAPIVVDSPSGGRGSEAISVVGEGGDVLLRIEAVEGGGAGSYRLLLGDPRPATAEDRRRAGAERAFAAAEELRRRADPGGARALYREALAGRQALGETLEEARCRERIGWMSDEMGHPDEAIEAYRDALRLYRRLGETRGEALVLNSLADVLRREGASREAVAAAREASALFTGLGDLHGQATALNNRAVAERSLGALQAAREHYEEALKLWRRLDDGARERITLRNLGLLELRLGCFAEARETFTRMLALDPPPRERAAALLDLGQSHLLAGEMGEEGEAARAREAFNEALAASRGAGEPSGEAAARTGLGLLDLAAGDLRGAGVAFRSALGLYRGIDHRRGEALVRLHLGELYLRSGEPERALDELRPALAFFARAEDPEGEAEALYRLARAWSGGNRLDDARAAMERSVALLEQVRSEPEDFDLRSGYFAGKQGFYEFFVELLLRLHARRPGQGLDERAFEVAERRRARGFLDRLAVDPSAGVETSSPGRPAVGAPRTVAELREHLLDERTLLLAFFLGRERSYLWALSRGSLDTFPLPPESDLEGLAREVRQRLARSDQRAERFQAEQKAAELGTLLFGPAAPRLAALAARPEAGRLLIVTEGALAEVPFPALAVRVPVAPGQPAAPGALPPPLIAGYELIVLPSASVPVALSLRARHRPRPTRTAAVLADPVFSLDDPRLSLPQPAVEESLGPDPGAPEGPRQARGKAFPRTGWRRLPGTRREAEAILALAPAGSTFTALGFEASRETFDALDLGDFRILHLATHAWVDPDRPQDSGLVLSLVDARGAPRDGLLRARELAGRELPELVVLSACHTAGGRVLPGEGVEGLARHFLHAGADGVIASLWPVRDEITAELMARFYGALWSEGRPPAAALRAAQLSLYREGEGSPESAPYAWAGFLFQGAPPQ